MSPSPSPTHRSLVAACASAHAEDPLWPLLVDRLRGPVRGGVLGVLASCGARRDPELVEELVQEVWCRLLERDRRSLALCATADERAVLGYVRRIAARVAVDVLRAGAALKRRPVHLVALELGDGETTGTADRRQCPERRLLARERIGGLLGLCRELLGRRATPDRLRIVRLAWIEGRSTTEIARLVEGWSGSAIDSLLHRLRRRLAERGVVPARRVRELPPRPGGHG